MLKVGGKQEDIIRNIQNKFYKLNSKKILTLQSL